MTSAEDLPPETVQLEEVEWREVDAPDDDDDSQVEEYDLTSTPNDFNILTIFNFVDSGAVKIPGFQRHYVWDIRRASKLIESLIIGLPVPQVFLYEEGRNSFLVIDGQQRLMTIYYFMKQRFPRPDKRAELRQVFSEEGGIPDEILHDDEYFENFRLRLTNTAADKPNRFARLSYATLGEYKSQFDLRTIRNVIVKQVSPSDDDSSIYEMFNRLNTGGINLTPQEIRASLYHSDFFNFLFRLNMDQRWRALLGRSRLDLHMRDIEILLRAVAMWRQGDEYAPSMVRFLNRFSKKTAKLKDLTDIESIVDWFLDAASDLPRGSFNTRQGRFQVPLFEAVFAATCREHARLGGDWKLSPEIVNAVRGDEQFIQSSSKQTTDRANVLGRLEAARRHVASEV